MSTQLTMEAKADADADGDLTVRRQAEHRIRRAASLARPGWIWAAALIMNAPSVAGAAVLAWFAFTSDSQPLIAVAGVLFALALFWVVVATADSWEVLRRFSRRFSQSRET
jgi:uncharacterized membrane protein YfcA